MRSPYFLPIHGPLRPSLLPKYIVSFPFFDGLAEASNSNGLLIAFPKVDLIQAPLSLLQHIFHSKDPVLLEIFIGLLRN
jgi:hypothetical protein